MSNISKISISLILLALLAIFAQSLIVCKIVVLLILFSCILLGHQEKTWVNPYYLFAITPFSLLIYTNLSNSFMQDLSPRTWVLAVINMVAFILSLAHTRCISSVERCIGPADTSLSSAVVMFTLLSVASTIFTYLTNSIFPLASVFSLCASPAIVCALKNKNTKQLFFVILILFSVSVGTLSKSSMLTYCIAIYIAYEKYYVSNRRKTIKMIVAVCVAAIVMVSAFSFANKDRENQSSVDIVEYYTEHGNVSWNYNSILFMPYMYLTTPWANLQYVIESDHVHTYGLWTVKPILGYLQMDEKSNYNIRAYSSFNTLTYIAVLYKDFGYWLSIIGSILIGIFVKKVYSLYLISRSPLDTASYILVAQATFEMFFSNHFFMQSYPITIVILMWLFKHTLYKNNSPQIENYQKQNFL